MKLFNLSTGFVEVLSKNNYNIGGEKKKMAEFEKCGLNRFLKWLGVFLICFIFPLTVVYSGWIWALTIAGVGIISILIAMSRAFDTTYVLSGFMRYVALALTAIAITVLYIDISIWGATLLLLIMAIFLLLLSFQDNCEFSR